MTNYHSEKNSPRRSVSQMFIPKKDIDKHPIALTISETEIENEIEQLYGPSYLLQQKAHREAWFLAIDSVVMKKQKNPNLGKFSVAISH